MHSHRHTSIKRVYWVLAIVSVAEILSSTLVMVQPNPIDVCRIYLNVCFAPLAYYYYFHWFIDAAIRHTRSIQLIFYEFRY